jgi:acetyl-CoA acetyltransferase family protein
MKEAVIIDACRSPIGRAGDRGVYRAIGFIDLMVPVLKAIVERNKLDPNLIDEVVIGSAALGGTMSRNIVLTAGFPQSVAGSDTSRQCASASNAIAIAAHYIMNDDADIIIAGGLETMDRRGPVQPWQIGQRGAPQMRGFGGPVLTKEQEEAKYPDDWKTAKLMPMLPPELPLWIYDMGRTAEELSERYGISREDSDRFALTSHEKAIAAQDTGLFKDEILPITINYEDGTTEVIDTDQCPRRGTSYERIAALPPAYKENGLVTAGNSCPRSDGAGAVLLMSKEKAKELGYKPMCTFRHAVMVGVDPTVMGVGPYPATEKILARTGMSIKDFDIIEINEAFACQVVYCADKLGMGPEEMAKLNPKGGAIAIGHPLGMTGARQAAIIAHEMVRRDLEWGLATLCVGGGQGMATIFQRENYD